jgi:hypothetical protein
MSIAELRNQYHQEICENIIYLDDRGIPNIADKGSESSSKIASGIVKRIAHSGFRPNSIGGQQAGSMFEAVNQKYLTKAFQQLKHLRPGEWSFDLSGDISQFEQYKHLAELSRILENQPELKTSIGTDYLITPDIVIARYPVSDIQINEHGPVLDNLDSRIAALTPLRYSNQQSLILHASISCKWTLRSDRAQNARTEALNLIRNRKGATPKIITVTAEPMPGRLASLAFGTGDIDCVYHFALNELRETVSALPNDESAELLETMIAGNRIRDISDLPFDLVS